MSLLERFRDVRHRVSSRIPLAAAALAIVICFAKPGLQLDRPRVDHVVVLDVTQSMNVQDALLDGRPIARLALAKHALHLTLDALPCGSRLGLAIFTEYRSYLLFTPVEVCANRAELRRTLAGIDGRMAWSGNSEIAKGLHSAIGIAKLLPDKPSLVFVTDGHEAPPLNPSYRPAFDDVPGEVEGLVVGVGALMPSPIPKADPQGRPLGFWAADEVMQTDPRSAASAGGTVFGSDATLGATPGREHLSSLHEAYLRLLAGENGMRFHRLQEPAALAAAMQARNFARDVPTRVDMRPALSAVALVCLLFWWWPRRGAGPQPLPVTHHRSP